MTTKRKSRNQGNRKVARKRTRGASGGDVGGMTAYRGPIIPRSFSAGTDTYTTAIIETYTARGDVSGVLSAYDGASDVYGFGSNPVATGSFSYLALAFSEYRTVAMRVEYVPDNVYQVTNATKMIIVVCDRANSLTLLASYPAAVSYSNHKTNTFQKKWSYTARMANIEESVFTPVGSPVSYYVIKWYSAGLTASTTYGRWIVTRTVEFRGRK